MVWTWFAGSSKWYVTYKTIYASSRQSVRTILPDSRPRHLNALRLPFAEQSFARAGDCPQKFWVERRPMLDSENRAQRR